jgi:hypothetical protein
MLVSKEKIKDQNGKIVGWIETDHLGNKTAKDFYGRLKGKYSKMTNLTKDFYGRIVAQGDATVGLLYRK